MRRSRVSRFDESKRSNIVGRRIERANLNAVPPVYQLCNIVNKRVTILTSRVWAWAGWFGRSIEWHAGLNELAGGSTLAHKEMDILCKY